MIEIDDPFADWKRLLNKSVYSIDGKKIGFLRKVLADYMVVRKGFIILTKYFIPTSLAEAVSKKGIRIRVTAVEAGAPTNRIIIMREISFGFLIPMKKMQMVKQ